MPSASPSWTSPSLKKSKTAGGASSFGAGVPRAVTQASANRQTKQSKRIENPSAIFTRRLRNPALLACLERSDKVHDERPHPVAIEFLAPAYRRDRAPAHLDDADGVEAPLISIHRIDRPVGADARGH